VVNAACLFSPLATVELISFGSIMWYTVITLMLSTALFLHPVPTYLKCAVAAERSQK